MSRVRIDEDRATRSIDLWPDDGVFEVFVPVALHSGATSG